MEGKIRLFHLYPGQCFAWDSSSLLFNSGIEVNRKKNRIKEHFDIPAPCRNVYIQTRIKLLWTKVILTWFENFRPFWQWRHTLDVSSLKTPRGELGSQARSLRGAHRLPTSPLSRGDKHLHSLGSVSSLAKRCGQQSTWQQAERLAPCHTPFCNICPGTWLVNSWLWRVLPGALSRSFQGSKRK